MRATRPFKPSPAIVISSLAILVSLSVATVIVRSVQYPRDLQLVLWTHTGTYITNSTQTGCLPGELLISVGTSWETDVDDQELWLSSLRPVTDSSGAVTSFRARGGNDSGTGRRFMLHVLCAEL